MCGFKIIIDDGFVAYEHNTDIDGYYSIDDVVKEINNRCTFKLDQGEMITSYEHKDKINSLIEDNKKLLKVINQLVVIKQSYMDLLDKYLENKRDCENDGDPLEEQDKDIPNELDWTDIPEEITSRRIENKNYLDIKTLNERLDVLNKKKQSLLSLKKEFRRDLPEVLDSIKRIKGWIKDLE